MLVKVGFYVLEVNFHFLRNYLVLTPNLLDGDKAFWITVFFAGLYHLLTR